MRRSAAILVLLVVFAVCPAYGQAGKSLDVYFLDMVGGGSTLIVTPLGESVLIDTGSLEPLHRDADRIIKACEYAGLEHIDYLVTTHLHSDHYGAILEVSERIPVKCFVDRGVMPPAQEQESRSFKQLYPLYQKATAGKLMTIKVGERISLRNDPAGKIAPMKLYCVASEKKVIGFDGDVDDPVAGYEIKEPDRSDNGPSIALVLRYGDFDFFAGGDITWNVEHHLAHPVNRVGKIDLYQVTHHGLDQSNNPLLLKALSPTVCVAMNGPRKGIQPRTFKAIAELPDLEALYQIHYNTQYGDAGNPPAEYIANKDNPDKGELIRACVWPEKGIFTVSIGPDGPKREYKIN